MSRSAHALLAAVACTVLLSACGEPPRALPSAPPAPARSGGPPLSSTGPSGFPGFPSLPTDGGFPTDGFPTGGLPPTTYPAPGATFPTTPTTTPPALPTTSTTPPPPAPAPACTGSPTKQQILDIVKGKPGIPSQPLEVRSGPFCAARWHFAILGIVGQDEDDVEPLLVVTNGRPPAVSLVAAGADVCTDQVEDDAPPGIRVRACGS